MCKLDFFFPFFLPNQPVQQSTIIPPLSITTLPPPAHHWPPLFLTSFYPLTPTLTLSIFLFLVFSPPHLNPPLAANLPFSPIANLHCCLPTPPSCNNHSQNPFFLSFSFHFLPQLWVVINQNFHLPNTPQEIQASTQTSYTHEYKEKENKSNFTTQKTKWTTKHILR